jgi:hypothetical protein
MAHLQGRFRRSPAITDTVQTDIGCNSVQQARGIAGIEARAPFEQPDEHVLTSVQRFVLVA